MNRNKRLLLALGLMGLGLSAWLLFTVAMVGSTLAPEQRELLQTMLAPRLVLVAMSLTIALVLMAALLRWLMRRYVAAPARLLEHTRVLLAAQAPHQMATAEAPELQALAEAINELAAQRDALRQDVAQRVAQASLGVQEEKNRLAALVSELTQSVVVCNLDGRIVLYNNRARLQFRALSQAPAVADGTELIGIGRSIYAVFDHQLVAHALENIHQRLARGAAAPSAQFATVTPSGQLLRVQMAPVRTGDAASDASAGFSGFVLMLDNMTSQYEEASQRDEMLNELAGAGQASLAAMQAALGRLGQDEDDADSRAHALDMLRREVGALSQRISQLALSTAQAQKTRWPMEEMLGSDLLSAAQRRLQSHCERAISIEPSSQGEFWLRVDSYLLLQALAYLAGRLVDEFDVRFLQLRLQEAGGRAHLDLIWSGHTVSTETVMTWQMDPMHQGVGRSPLSVRDVVERHGGELWFERERVRHQAFFRFALPLAAHHEPLEAELLQPTGSRPEFYDFDLFQASEESRALEERPLASLVFTVFDTETTGLQPSAGDEIIQVGAVRIVNGKLLRQESFEQLVDPGRTIPAATIPIHGISQDMVQGQPRIGEVLKAFHTFARDSVLVAHNAAFDMRFLQIQEAKTGLAFRQPVLDTLLLSALVHPNQDSHRLEAIAERFNVTVLGRHTALGDALVTAEVFLRLIPLLQAMGIHTLGQAREAAQKTYFARLKY